MVSVVTSLLTYIEEPQPISHALITQTDVYSVQTYANPSELLGSKGCQYPTTYSGLVSIAALLVLASKLAVLAAKLASSTGKAASITANKH